MQTFTGYTRVKRKKNDTAVRALSQGNEINEELSHPDEKMRN